MKKFFFQKGQSLLEIVFATTVVALVLTSIAASMTMSLKTTVESKYKGVANYIAQDSHEFFHRERAKLGWADFKEILLQITGSICMNSTPGDLEDLLTFESICNTGVDLAGVNNEFFREVYFEFPEEDLIHVFTVVTWYEGDREKSTQLKTIFTDQVSNLAGPMPTPPPTP